MTRRERMLGLLFVLILAVGAGWYAISPPSLEMQAPPKEVHYVVTEAQADEFRRTRSAELNEDLEKRCLETPDLPEFSWDPALIKAMCHLHARAMLSWKEINDALDRRDAAFLSHTFDGYLDASLNGGQHGFIDWTYAYTFNNPSNEELETTTRWIELDPDSGFAYAARAAHYVAAAYEARGNAYARDTPAENMERMNAFVLKAKADLDEAIRRNPKLIAVYGERLRIAQLLGDEDLRQRSVSKAFAIDPADQAIFDRWLDAAEPRWGGSIEEMERAGRIAMEHAATNPLLMRVQGRAPCERALEAACTTCGRPSDEEKALELFRESARRGPTRCFLQAAAGSASRRGELVDAARYYTQAVRFLDDGASRVLRDGILYRIGEREWAKHDLDVQLTRYPDFIAALNEKAYILEVEGQPAESAGLYRHSIDIDAHDERAALQLSRLYLSKVPNFEKAAPIVADLLARKPTLARAWLYKAALARGDEDACREALRKYLQYVDRNDTYEKGDIARATARLKQLDAKGTVPPPLAMEHATATTSLVG